MKEFKIVNVYTGEEKIAFGEVQTRLAGKAFLAMKEKWWSLPDKLYEVNGWKRAESITDGYGNYIHKQSDEPELPEFKAGDKVKFIDKKGIEFYGEFKHYSSENKSISAVRFDDDGLLWAVDSRNLIMVDDKEQKFKIGDRVKMKLVDGNWVHGKIVSLHFIPGIYSVEWEDWGDKILLMQALDSHLVLIEKPKFKIGDKVKLNGSLEYGNISRICGNHVYVIFSGAKLWVRTDDLTLVNQPNEEKQMKLEIYKESKEDAKEPVRLSLHRQDDGSITLRAVDEDGDCVDEGNLVTIRSNGKLYLHPRVCPELGFPLDSRGRLLIDD